MELTREYTRKSDGLTFVRFGNDHALYCHDDDTGANDIPRIILDSLGYDIGVFNELKANGELLQLEGRSEVFIASYFIHNKGIDCYSWRKTRYAVYWEDKLFVKKNGVVKFALETDEALAEKYALNVSKQVNKYYENAMGIQICLLEKGVGDDVYKDVCYPILPKSKLPFAVGSYAERSYIGTKFIQEFCLKFNVKPLPILLDNMESLDEYTRHFVDGLGVQYIGALVD